MPDQMIDMWKWVAGIAVTAWLTLLSWTGKRQVARIDTLELTKASKTSTDKRIDRMITTLDDHVKETRTSLESIRQESSRTAQMVARIDGKMEASK